MSKTKRKINHKKFSSRGKIKFIVKESPEEIEDLKHDQSSAVDGSTKIKGCKETKHVVVKLKKSKN